ncbi:MULTISPECIES: DUF424 domain-containing protein [Nitrosopumilus]|uniref:DUF424 domain-containing protein n=1 Tax=Nitrosopumilus piranensis TaxID=1582439 RepID=A0A0C5CDI8_9ARCH|nr:MULTISPECIES: DUF424 domain-containing protein [Nitrosopumilus]AJM93282.1 hypothetical protein NPIRD3C_2072 [Nitrosopumilus piranensis]KAF6245634.1 DUF424 domain-containing protein [Nitrosopumilus sp. b2]
MPFAVRQTDYQKNPMLNICDAELLGKTIVEGELNMHISESYYGERFVDKEEAEVLLKNSAIINMVGNETISLSIDLGVGSENGVKKISGVPFLIVFKM